VPPSVIALLLLAQFCCLAVTIRRGIWKALPVWTIYVCIASAQIVTGLVLTFGISAYPAAVLYLEPLIVLGQIAFTIEAGISYLQSSYAADDQSPESRLLLWLIPMIPTAVGLPIEMGFVQEAVSAWSRDPGDALRLLYLVHLFLSGTLFIGLVGTRFVAQLQRRRATQAHSFHLHLLMVYVGSYAIGYAAKLRTTGHWDDAVMAIFFLAIPLACYLTWAWRMNSTSASAFKIPPSGENMPAGQQQSRPESNGPSPDHPFGAQLSPNARASSGWR
jgi:hypothetical protein